MPRAEVPVMASSKQTRTMTIDLTNKDLDDISIGDIVMVEVTGKVKHLSAGEPAEKKTKENEFAFSGFPPDMRIDVQSTKVTVTNDFAELAED